MNVRFGLSIEPQIMVFDKKRELVGSPNAKSDGFSKSSGTRWSKNG